MNMTSIHSKEDGALLSFVSSIIDKSSGAELEFLQINRDDGITPISIAISAVVVIIIVLVIAERKRRTS